MKKSWYPESSYRSKTTLSFNFNEDAVAAAGFTTDELLEEMREYAKECGVNEIAYGVFAKEGPDAMAILVGYAVRKSNSDHNFVNYLNSWIANVNGNVEDCKVAIERKYKRQFRDRFTNMKMQIAGESQQRTILTFNFDEEAVRAAGLTTDELLEDMRTYAKECGITEVSYGVFEKTGVHAVAMLYGYVVRKNDEEPEFINYLSSWIADSDGEIEDCKASILKYNK